MAILCDWEIRSQCEGGQMVWPFNPELVNPASLDVVLGNNLLVEVDDGPFLKVNIAQKTKENPYLINPGCFCLAETRECFNLPDDISAQFVLKSSRAREGLNHLLAGWCDPGWHGSKLTLELKNERRYHDLPLYPGLKIGQMVFHYMNNVPMHSYALTGNYNNHLTVMPSVA